MTLASTTEELATEERSPQLTAARVGWVGTGRMGAALARRLARAGADVAAWNRTRSKAEALADAGVAVVDTLAELGRRDVVFTMVSTSKDLLAVTRGEGGLLHGKTVPRVLIDCSTVDADASAAVRQACAERGVAFLAAPVSGNAKAAAAGALSLVVSGPEQTYHEVEPLLACLGRSITYVGPDEVARLVKICHNLLLGVVAQSLAEITVLAEKGGVRRAAFLEFINDSVMGSTFTRYKSPALVHLDWTPTFTPVLLRKDFDLGLAAAHELGVPMPVAALTAQLVQQTISRGHGEDDFAVLLEQQAEAAGLRLEPEDAEVDDGLGPEDAGVEESPGPAAGAQPAPQL